MRVCVCVRARVCVLCVLCVCVRACVRANHYSIIDDRGDGCVATACRRGVRLGAARAWLVQRH